MVLYRRPSMGIADLQEYRRILAKPGRLRVCFEILQEAVEQTLAPHAVAQHELVLRPHEQELVDEKLRVIRIVRTAQPEQQVDDIDACEVPRVRAAVFVQAHLVGFVIGPHAVEKTINIELSVPKDVLQIEEVVISAQKENDNITSSEMNVTKFDPKDIETIPVIFGEKDVMKTLPLQKHLRNHVFYT